MGVLAQIAISIPGPWLVYQNRVELWYTQRFGWPRVNLTAGVTRGGRSGEETSAVGTGRLSTER